MKFVCGLHKVQSKNLVFHYLQLGIVINKFKMWLLLFVAQKSAMQITKFSRWQGNPKITFCILRMFLFLTAMHMFQEERMYSIGRRDDRLHEIFSVMFGQLSKFLVKNRSVERYKYVFAFAVYYARRHILNFGNTCDSVNIGLVCLQMDERNNREKEENCQ